MAKTKIIKLVNLQVNTENYRFEPVASQKEAINLMINSLGPKIYTLAEHIVDNGLNPNDRIQVVLSSHDSTKYNVVEGNRRTVALKLINNPDILDSKSHLNLKKKFQKLKDKAGKNLITEVECTVYDNPSEADKWIKLKHAGQLDGAGTVPWDSKQISRFEEKVEGKSSLSLQVVKLLEKSDIVDNEIKLNLKSLKVTNLDRLISDPKVREFLGIEINNGIIQSKIETEEVIKGLSHVVKDLMDPNFKVTKIYTKEDRNDYINNFPKIQIPDKTKIASKPWQFNSTSTPAPLPAQSKPKVNSKERKTLIPRSFKLTINQSKVNNIYHELTTLDVARYTNATAVLFRVFVELSVDCYLEEHKLIKAPSAAKSELTSLQQKINVVASHMDSKGFADSAICKGIKSEIKDKNDIMGIDTWHAYVHNNKFSPKHKNLITTWDNIESFIAVIWANVK